MTTTSLMALHRHASEAELAKAAVPATVFIVGLPQLSREGLDRVLVDKGFEIAGHGNEIGDFIAYSNMHHSPELLLIDVSGAEAELFNLVNRAREGGRNTRIVVLADTVQASDLGQAFAAGADGYLLTSISSNALRESLCLVLLGEKVFPTCLASLMFKPGPMPHPRPADPSFELSVREKQILTCLTAGFSNKVIADRLKIAEATVKVHLKTLCRKISVSNRTQAAIWAINRGLSVVGDEPHQSRREMVS